MKTKFLLMLLALTGLCWANSAAADTPTATKSTADLSQQMAELIGFDLDTHSSLAWAIDRALIAQTINNGTIEMRTAGVPVAKPDLRPTKQQPTIMGKIAVPTKQSNDRVKPRKTTTRSPIQPPTNHDASSSAK